MGAVGRESELDAPTTLGTSARCDGSLSNFGVGVSASPMEEGTAVETEGCASDAVAEGVELTLPKLMSKNARKLARRRESKRAQRGAEQAAMPKEECYGLTISSLP